MPGKIPDGWITPAQAAIRLGVSVDTVRRWIRQGKLKAHKEGDRYWIDPDILPVSAVKDVGQEPDSEVMILRERVRELERDKAYLQELVVDLRKQIEKQQETIEMMQQTINTLTLRALPPPRRSLMDRIKRMFKRQREEKEKRG